MKHEFTDIMTVGEAAEKWGKSPISVKHLCTGIQGRPPAPYHRRMPEIRECMAGNEGGHGAPVWERKRRQGVRVVTVWQWVAIG